MKKKEADPARTQLIVGILSFVGVLITVLATVFGPIVQENIRQKNLPTQTPIVIVASPTQAEVIPTDTVPPGDPTSTPAPATNTPEPTFAATTAPILVPGKDWQANCISILWVLYPKGDIPSENNCLKSPVDNFFTKDGKFAFGFSVNVQSAEQHGLFVKLPSDGKFTINLHLNEVVNGEILVGVFAEPDFNSAGALMVIPASNNLKQAKLLFKTMPGQKLFSKSLNPVDATNGIFDFSFSFNNGEVTANAKSNQITSGAMPVLSSDKWLFIGYQVFIGSNRLNAEFSDLVITQK